jgi:RNA polymerase sigma-70 factor, ECF subfamily
VAGQALTFSRLSPYVRPALVNAAAGVVVAAHGRPVSVMGFIVIEGRIVEIDAIADPERLRPLDLAVLDH